ncbi:MAG TPA: hypothetical protein P5571_15150 [Candidatus Krumholzibacteria bacterium]|nr:hypothetical protein [Candidatus Krumholzibacteria bacterium]
MLRWWRRRRDLDDSHDGLAAPALPDLDDLDPGAPLVELMDYALDPEIDTGRRILLRVDERERMGSILDLSLGGLAELVRTYAGLFIPSDLPPRRSEKNPDSEGGPPWHEN